MKKFSSNWRKVASNLSNVRKTADYQADAESRGIIIQEGKLFMIKFHTIKTILINFDVKYISYLKPVFCTEGSSTPSKGRKFEGMSSKTQKSVKDDVPGQVSRNLQIIG